MMARTLLAFALLVAMGMTVRAAEGGVKDSSGLVWSQSQKLETGSWWDWTFATTNAANYSIVDVDAIGTSTIYDDWRLPTVHEIQAAILDGTLAKVMPIGYYTEKHYIGSELVIHVHATPLYYTTWIWTAETRGNKAWMVQVVRDSSDPWPLNVASSGASQLWLKTAAFEAFFVRGKAPVK